MARILFAEDDSFAQKYARTLIERLGHECIISPNGRNAYELLKAENEFDLLITDVMMPEMDGVQLIKTLRGDSRFADLPIVIMSAVVTMSEISNILKLGATYFIQKPLKEDDLANYINRCAVKKECTPDI